MITVSYNCPHCSTSCRQELSQSRGGFVECAACRQRLELPEGAIVQGRVKRCVVCPSTELYVRKDFSQKWGVGIVVTGLAASSVAWFFRSFLVIYAILFLTALMDAGLYLIRGNVLQCYRCQAEFRGVSDLEGSEPLSETVTF